MKTLAEVVEQGRITLRSNNKEFPYSMRVLNKSDIGTVLHLQSSITAAMEKKELYVPIPEEELLYMLAGNGESLGLFIDDKMCAACSLLFRVKYEDNMAREIGFTSEQLSQVAQLELSLVDPDLRGYKLQCRMADILARRALERGDFRYLFTTVSPYNYASIQTVTSLGLQIAKLCKMYYNWDRYIVYRDFSNPILLDTANSITVLNTSFAEQHQLLNDGFRGFSQFKDEEGIKIMYARILKN